MKTKFLFIHVAKCGGTYIRTVLSNYFAENKQLYDYPQQLPYHKQLKVKYDNNLPVSWNVENILDYDFIYGHSPFEITRIPEIKENFNIIVNFRSPFEFLKSHYFHIIREILSGNINLSNDIQKDKYESVIYGPDHYLNVINSKTDMFLGDNHFQMFRNIDKYIQDIDFLVENTDVVTFTHHIINEFKLQKLHDLYVDSNVNHIKTKMDYIFDQLQPVFKSRFPQDYELYNYLQQNKWRPK